jgi:hypothetical protein
MNKRYFKADPTEIINTNDLIRLDPTTLNVKVTTDDNIDDYIVNEKLIVGVCTSSNNETPLPKTIDCGDSTSEYETLDLGDSTTETDHILECEDSTINERCYIEVDNEGIVDLTYDIPEDLETIEDNNIQIGDKVVMGFKSNTVIKSCYDHRQFIRARTIGKVIEVLGDNKVKVLLDIE